MIDFRTFDFSSLQLDQIVQLIFSDKELKKGEVKTLQWRLNHDEKLYQRLAGDLKFAKFLTGRLASDVGACALDERPLELLSYAQKINKTQLKLPALKQLIHAFDTMQVIAPSGIKFGLNKKQMLKLLLDKMAKRWEYEVELTDFIKKNGYFYFPPDAGHIYQTYGSDAGAICFDDNSIRVTCNQIDKYFDIFCHELTHVKFNDCNATYFNYEGVDPFLEVISEAEAYATSFFVENGWDVFQKMKRLALLKTKKEMKEAPLFQIYQRTAQRLKKAYVQLFLAEDTKKAFDEMVEKMGVRKVYPTEKKLICTYIRKAKKMTIQTSLHIDNFALKVPHPEFLPSANRYLKLRYGAGVEVSEAVLKQWVGLFKQKQKQILSQLKMSRDR